MWARDEILAPLGAGGMGEVYRAHDSHLGRDVAIKFLPRDDGTSRYTVERFLREARAASALNHPNIVTVFDAGQDDIGYFIVMELVRGRTLRSFIGIQPDIGLLGDLATQIAKALAAVHEIGVVHRDIKPENIMVRDDGYVKVLDFGLARSTVPRPVDAPEPGAVTTISQGVLGTLRYMSPEQGNGLQLDQATAYLLARTRLVRTGDRPAPVRSRHVVRRAPLDPVRYALATDAVQPWSAVRCGWIAASDARQGTSAPPVGARGSGGVRRRAPPNEHQRPDR